MDIFSLLGTVLVCALVGTVLKSFSKSMSQMVYLSVTIASFAVLLLASSDVTAELVSYNIGESVKWFQYVKKALGISFLTSFTADVCRTMDSPEAEKAAHLVGQAQLIILSLPLTKEILSVALNTVQG